MSVRPVRPVRPRSGTPQSRAPARPSSCSTSPPRLRRRPAVQRTPAECTSPSSSSTPPTAAPGSATPSYSTMLDVSIAQGTCCDAPSGPTRGMLSSGRPGPILRRQPEILSPRGDCLQRPPRQTRISRRCTTRGGAWSIRWAALTRLVACIRTD